VNYENITTDEQLQQYCRKLATAPTIAFDTEFVAEHTFRPVLCLVQVAAAGGVAVIDPLTIHDMTPFWETLTSGTHETIVHAARGEMEFCLQAVGRFPSRLFDVQLAAGFIGVEYPAGYGTLIARLLGDAPKKNETRTDWRRRPLSQRQIEYALDDVRYLEPLRNLIGDRIEKLGREAWLGEEMASWQEELRRSLTQERWRRVSGNTSLGARGLAIVRELWRWRQAEAERRDRPPRTILRDDLIVELARRQSADVKQIQALRGMEWGKIRQNIPQIAEAIQRALASPERDVLPPSPRENVPQLSVLGQVLSAALGSICHQANLASSLVGGPSDVRDLILYRTAQNNGRHREEPLLAKGWRAEVVGHLFEDLLAGKVALRIADPLSEHPLILEPNEEHEGTKKESGKKK
jgi:ribonuclease D